MSCSCSTIALAMLDTSPSARRFYHEHLRALTPAERLRIAAGLSMSVRRMAEAGIRQRHPDASMHEIEVRLAVRLYGREIVAQVFQDIPSDAR